jgi:PDZ domain-containing protein
LNYNSDFDSRAFSKPRRSVGLIFLALGVAALFAVWFFPTPYVIEQPGPAYNVLGTDGGKQIISVEDAATYPTSGNLDLLTVQIAGNRARTPSWTEILSAWMDPSKSVLPIEEVFPANQTAEQSTAESTAMMEQSQQEAIAVALKQLGYQVPVQIYVSEVTKDSPSSGQIIAADFVQKVNGIKVTTIDQLREQINLFDGTHPLNIELLRAGEKKSFEITPIKDETGAYRIGILAGYKYDFPVKVKLQLADVGGPSGGMMFALGIYDKLTPGQLAGGKYIAGTGTIDSSGTVGPIGGIQQKMFGAKNAGAKFFLAPKDNCSEVVGHIPSGLQVFKVTTFKDALSAIEKIGKDEDLKSLPTCTTK